MAVTIVKAKDLTAETKKVTPESQAVEMIATVNKLGDVYTKMRPNQDALAALTKQYKPLFSAVQDHVDVDNEPDQEVTLKTDRYAVTFTAHGNMSKCADPAKAFAALEKVEKGLAKKLMTFTVGDLKKYLTPAQCEALIETTRTKARSLSVVSLED